MPLPKYNQLQIPALRILQAQGALRMRDFVQPLSLAFSLSDEDINEVYPSGNGHIFYDRISWALSYLNMAGLVDKPSRGTYSISNLGLQLLNTPEKISEHIEQAVKSRTPVKTKGKSDKKSTEVSVSELTPQEELYQSFKNIKDSVFEEILSTIFRKTPAAFEKLVVQLLQKMGYGGEIKDAGLVTQQSNDGGIDGIIKEDILGFGRIHIQAKRYKLDITIGREDIQKFVGALAVAQSNKGVFITTSSFTKGAIDYAKSLNGATTVILIDGMRLANYIYEYGLGMQIEQTIEIKKLDADFWDGMNEA